MNFSGIAYLIFTIALATVLAGIIFYYYNPKRKEKVEKPKQSMLDDDQ
ncbi:cbb3-type cytochrome c oxidase subunit 3 [Chlorobium sp. BLA1]|nr:cbb3-type cytochrome c oxidase subunit 3 [Candidatus Chlorobium masyuteum]NHQ60164.1 cbb3-type cytochrome c oxidase subunit 3 [Candidatus Chlorobium masyuteum]NTU44573.1 cbb3-type cytochrome c oxidase subunit 3 [Chlorobiaceae bacterium]